MSGGDGESGAVEADVNLEDELESKEYCLKHIEKIC